MKPKGYLRFFKQFKIVDHLFMTVSKGGPGMYIRVLPGVSIGWGPQGIHWAIGLPGSGLSYRTRLQGSQKIQWKARNYRTRLHREKPRWVSGPPGKDSWK